MYQLLNQCTNRHTNHNTNHAEEESTNMSTYQSFNISKYLIQHLEELHSTDKENEHRRNKKAKNALLTIFGTEINHTKTTEEDKQTIGPQLITALPTIHTCIAEEINKMTTTSYEEACYLRSGIQLLMDNYKNYFTESAQEQAMHAINELRQSKDITNLDNALRNYPKPIGNPHIDITRTINKLESLPTPAKHIWWDRLLDQSTNRKETENRERNLGKPACPHRPTGLPKT